MRKLPSRLRRLDDALADLPLEEPMLLTGLDGFLTGVLVSPDVILPGEWMANVWGVDESGAAPFEEPSDVRWFADAVMAHHIEIVRDLGRGKPRPIFDIDERNGEVLWELWIDGFAEAMALRPDQWAALADGDDLHVATAVASLSTLIAISRNESVLDSMAINAVHDKAPAQIVESVLRLHSALMRGDGASSVATISAQRSKLGRNEPCRCGSGTKLKRCCE